MTLWGVVGVLAHDDFGVWCAATPSISRWAEPDQVTATKLAERRLAKGQLARTRLAATQRARFIADVAATHPTEAAKQEAGRLVQLVRSAKNAAFLQQYRIAD